MEKINRDDQKRWALLNSAENADDHAEEDHEDDEEALSLSDLPLVHHATREQNHEGYQGHNPLTKNESHHEDFDFCSFSKESEMCSADEVFFQGQILPLRHSVSSEKGLLQRSISTRSISRSESMDHCYSAGFISSRSSSISSHQSSSSSGSSAAKIAPKYKPKLPPRNQFHSHPSPSPRIHFPNNKQSMNQNHRNRKSTVWNIFKLGLVATPPEIALQDIKTRCNSNINGSRNSTSSNSSSICSSNTFNKKTTKQSMAAILLGGGCKCSADAVDAVSSSRAAIMKKSSDVDRSDDKETVKSVQMTRKQTAKKQLSHHRTFEWLKQLSLEEGAPDEAKILN